MKSSLPCPNPRPRQVQLELSRGGFDFHAYIGHATGHKRDEIAL
jgi:hypothetical protein